MLIMGVITITIITTRVGQKLVRFGQFEAVLIVDLTVTKLKISYFDYHFVIAG